MNLAKTELLLLILVVSVIFVNGWTDAPNAIACAVSTRSMSCKSAIAMAAVCNLLGILLMGLVNASVADTVTGLFCLSGSPAHSITVLCAAMLSVVLFAVAAWFFGIPTSESHALIAAVFGAGLALGSPPAATALYKVLMGLALSLVLGLGLGFYLTRLLGELLKRLGAGSLSAMQIGAAAGMAFMHGAQDGQKVLAVLVIADRLIKGITVWEPIRMAEHIPAMLLCAAAMALGTSVGGGRILSTVGEKMAVLQKHEGVCADFGAGISLLLASLTGVPMSTTHTKTTAMMGAALTSGKSRVDVGVIRGMLLAWAITFPVCGLLGYFFANLFLRLL